MSWIFEKMEDMEITERLAEEKARTIRMINCMVDAGFTQDQCESYFVDLDKLKGEKTLVEFNLACVEEYFGCETIRQ